MRVATDICPDRTVTGLGDPERLLLWALRHRVATGDPASPHLIRAFLLLCGPVTAPSARQALDALVVAIDTYARRPLAFFDWRREDLTADEASLLDLCATVYAKRPVGVRVDDLVVSDGVQPTLRAARRLVHHLAAAGLRLRPPDHQRAPTAAPPPWLA